MTQQDIEAIIRILGYESAKEAEDLMKIIEQEVDSGSDS
jgi:hypothetical protein